MIIGDSAFTNWSWIIKPYPNHAVLTPTERLFNAKLCKVRCTVVRAFVLLKSRWQIILKQNEQKFKSVGRTVTAAVVIHNFRQKLQDFYEPDAWGQHPPWKWSLRWGTGHRQCYLRLSCRAGCNLEKMLNRQYRYLSCKYSLKLKKSALIYRVVFYSNAHFFCSNIHFMTSLKPDTIMLACSVIPFLIPY